MMERIPDHAPLVLRRSTERLWTYYGLSILVIGAIVACCSLIFAYLADFDTGALVLLAILVAPVTLIAVATLIWRLTAELRSGPTLAANSDGLWIQARKWPVRPQFLRWEEIAWIAVRRYGVDRSVCVMPHAEPPAPGQDRRERQQIRRQLRDYGAPYTASITWGDRPEAEVMSALGQLAAGRCQVTLA